MSHGLVTLDHGASVRKALEKYSECHFKDFGESVKEMFDAHVHPIIVGEHESIIPKDCAKIRFDAEQGTADALLGVQRPSKPSHMILSAAEIHLRGMENSLEFLDEFSHKHEKFFLSINMGVFAAPFVPGVSSPEPLGLYPWQVIPLLEKLASTKKLVGIGFCGLSDQEPTALLAAALIAAYMVS